MMESTSDIEAVMSHLKQHDASAIYVTREQLTAHELRVLGRIKSDNSFLFTDDATAVEVFKVKKERELLIFRGPTLFSRMKNIEPYEIITIFSTAPFV